ncbi:antitoxin [Actinacidiphila paucisporea]|uniref:MT0933-like antitoxin protein n=1 Tax=Actinacidiphila paucisporea TaxID=310782 RepID=A0A1M7Q557_9ACTN|nr:antitoxin [Actinacidiphila paucisporea]SHN25484.1 MT0933-like antitoxin protein [Actinacidiphila paucisporea]
MSFMDTLKDKLGLAKDKAGDMARQHPDKVDSGIDKAARTADSKTGGKYSEKIDTGADKARDAADKLGGEGGGRDTGGTV